MLVDRDQELISIGGNQIRIRDDGLQSFSPAEAIVVSEVSRLWKPRFPATVKA
jgi:hypothetical protein